MTEPPFHINLTAGTPTRMDGLCETCHNPALWRVPVLIISEHGASEAGHIEMCDDCDTGEDEIADDTWGDTDD